MKKIKIITMITFIFIMTTGFRVSASEFWGPTVVEWRNNVAYSSTGHIISNEWAFDMTTIEKDIFVKLDSNGKVIERAEEWPGSPNPEIKEGKTGFVQTVFILDPEHEQFEKLVGKKVEVKFWDSFGNLELVEFNLLPGRNLGKEVELLVGNIDVEANIIGQTSSDRVNVIFEEFIVVQDNTVRDELFVIGLSESTIKDIEDEINEGKENDIEEENKEDSKKTSIPLSIIGFGLALSVLIGGGYVIFKKIKEMREN